MNLKDLLKEEKIVTGIFEGERAKLRDFIDKKIEITNVSDELEGDYGTYRIIQFKSNKKLYTTIINSRTVVYKIINTLANHIEKLPVTAIVKEVSSKKNPKRKYLMLE
jgi:phage portal protein BeeE